MSCCIGIARGMRLLTQFALYQMLRVLPAPTTLLTIAFRYKRT